MLQRIGSLRGVAPHKNSRKTKALQLPSCGIRGAFAERPRSKPLTHLHGDVHEQNACVGVGRDGKVVCIPDAKTIARR